MTDDPHDLQRFRDAQDDRGIYDRAVQELRAGEKRSHWMWFVFPQVAGLGRSPAAQRYAIRSLEEARAYLQDPVLGPRLVECARILADKDERDAALILGGTDAMKLRSSMTLFARAAPEQPVFEAVLDRFYDGRHDSATLDLLDG